MKKIANNKILMFLLAFVIFIPCVFLLSACGSNSTQDPQIVSIQATYKDNTFDFSNGHITVQYEDDLDFVSSDFKIVLKFDDNSTQEITSGFNFKIFKIVDTNEIETTSFEIGNYKLHFEYEDFTCNLHVTVAETVLNKNNVECNLQKSYAYNPKAQLTPDFTLTYNSKTLVKDVDYTVTYGDNNSVGEATGSVVVNFIGIYQGEISYYFDITAIEAGEVVFKDVITTYDGNYKGSLCEIDFSEIEGIEDIYYYFYNNLEESVAPMDAGTYRVVAQIVVKEGYSEVQNKEFTLTIDPMDISKINLSDYSADNIEVTFKNAEYTVTDLESILSFGNITYELSMSIGSGIDNFNVSNSARHGQLEMVGTGNYTGTLNIPFNILPYNVNWLYVVLNDYEYYIYDNTEKTISKIQAYFDYEIELTQGIDYSIEYSNNINAGEATYTVVGLGNYAGTRNDKFTIQKAQINLAEYSFQNTTSTYNGTDQSSTLLALDSSLPEQVEAIYTTENYYGMSGASPISTMQNAGNWYVYVTLAIKSEYTNNYTLSGNTQFSDSITINPVVVTSASFDTTKSSFEGGDGTIENLYYYTYSGSAKTPKVIITATLNDKPYTLVEGTDFTISYYLTSDGYNTTPVNAGNYGLRINYYGASGDCNFAYAYDGNYYIYQDSNLLFNINKKVIEDGDIAWPTTYRIVWGTKAYLDSTDFKTISKNDTITIEGELVDVTFTLKSSDLYGFYDTWVDNEDKIEIEFTSQNYQVENHTSTVTIVSLFTEAKLNGTTLTAAELDAISTLTLGDKLDITFSNAYQLKYRNNTYGYDNHCFDSISGFSKIIGTDTKDDEYCYEAYAYLYVCTADGQELTGREFTINRNIFSELKSYNYDSVGSEYNEYINYLNQNCLEELDWNVNENGKLVITLSQTGYTLNYDLIDTSDISTTYADKVSTMTWINENNFKQVVVRIYNAQDELVLTLHYNFTIV